MASSYFTESGAPRDFRVSSTESDGHYKKCLLCFTVKRNFYCVDCIRAGNFVHSSMPYSDRYAEKQAKLLRMKVNRKHILDRCERLLSPKLKRDTLVTEAKQSRDRLDLLRLAIEQRRSSIEEKRRELMELKNYNNDLSLKLPRYQKRVASLGKHAQLQLLELQSKINTCSEQVEALASLRRARIRQLTKYIFPVYMSYDASDSLEDMEFVVGEAEEPPQRPRLHIGAAWLAAHGDCAHAPPSACRSAESAAGGGGGAGAALALCAQLVALLAWTLDVRLPHAISLNEYCNWRVSERVAAARARRLCACSAALWAAGAKRPPPAPPHTHAPPHALAALHALAHAASADEPALGRVAAGGGGEAAEVAEWCAAWAVEESGGGGGGGAAHDAEPEPEHLHWPDPEEMEMLSGTPPAAAAAAALPPTPAPSLVTSAAASLASMWRGWTK